MGGLSPNSVSPLSPCIQDLLGHPPSPLGSGESPHRPMGWVGPTGGPRNPFVTPGTLPKVPESFPELKHHFPIYQSSSPDHSGTPRDVRDLIRDSEQLSVITIHNSILPKR